MRVEVEINGRARHVEVEGGGSAFTVTLDGRRQLADVTVINGVWSLILEPAEAGPHDGKSGPHDGKRPAPDVGAGFSRLRGRRVHEISVVEQPPGSGSLVIHVNGRVVPAVVAPGLPPDVPRTEAKKGDVASRVDRKEPAGPHRITAPMPGKVVTLLAKPGDQVAARQGVIVIEAMKMENELRSPRAGIVAEVQVAEGALVEAGAVLVIIE